MHDSEVPHEDAASAPADIGRNTLALELGSGELAESSSARFWAVTYG